VKDVAPACPAKLNLEDTEPRAGLQPRDAKVRLQPRLANQSLGIAGHTLNRSGYLNRALLRAARERSNDKKCGRQADQRAAERVHGY
jgi:hypothetical protein